METSAWAVWLIPAPPLISAAVILLFTFRSRWLSHTVALGAIGISLVLGWSVVFGALRTPHFAEHPLAASLDWLPTGNTALRMGVAVDPLTVVMLCFVPLACALIILYSIGYSNFGKALDAHDQPGSPPHNGVEPMYARFFAFLSLFAGAMLLLVVADNERNAKKRAYMGSTPLCGGLPG